MPRIPPSFFVSRCSSSPGFARSMGSVGDAYDNAMCESFFATLECELLDRTRFKNQVEARLAVFDFIEGWYNPHRRHFLHRILLADQLREETDRELIPQTSNRLRKRVNSTLAAPE
jgi:hypothetical protein